MPTIQKEKVYCAACGAECISKYEFTTGYGIDKQNRKICYACCAKIDLADMREHGNTCLYLSYETLTQAEYDVSNLVARRDCFVLDYPSWRHGCKTFYAKNAKVGNWPGSLSFKAKYMKRGGHNMAGCRYDVWFTVRYDDGTVENWHGYRVGDNTQICHCKRLKH